MSFKDELKTISQTDFYGTERFINVLHQYLNRNQQPRFVIYADYDVDGVMSGLVTGATLEIFGVAFPEIIYPSMKTGYGLNQTIIDKIINHRRDHRPTVLITADNGIALSKDSIKLPNNWNILITDHHQGNPDVFPSFAKAVVDPNRADTEDDASFKGFCGAGVMWKLMLAYAQKYGTDEQWDAVYNLVPFVALGTVCDQMKITNQNKQIVDEGLKAWNNQSWIRQQISKSEALAKVQTLPLPSIALQMYGFMKDYPKFNHWAVNGIDDQTFGWSLGPLINSSRRMTEESKLAYQMFLSPTDEKRQAAYAELEKLNNLRKSLSSAATSQLIEELAEDGVDSNIVVAVTDSPLGVCGIVASRLVDEFHRPAIVVTTQPEHYGGASGRSIDGIDILKFLRQANKKQPNLISAFGGHKAACGLTLAGTDENELKASANKLMNLSNELVRLSARSNVEYQAKFKSWDELVQSKFSDLKTGSKHPFLVTVNNPKQLLSQASAKGKRHDYHGLISDADQVITELKFSESIAAALRKTVSAAKLNCHLAKNRGLLATYSLYIDDVQ